MGGYKSYLKLFQLLDRALFARHGARWNVMELLQVMDDVRVVCYFLLVSDIIINRVCSVCYFASNRDCSVVFRF